MNKQTFGLVFLLAMFGLVMGIVCGYKIGNNKEKELVQKIEVLSYDINNMKARIDSEALIKSIKPELDPSIVKQCAISIDKYALENGLDSRLIIAIIMRSSGFNPVAISKYPNVPERVGLMQLEKPEGEELPSLFYIDTNIKEGCSRLMMLQNENKNIVKSLKEFGITNEFVNDVLEMFAELTIAYKISN